MSLTPAEAQSALKDIEKTENRAAASQHGRFAAPHLIIWGVVWAIGYAVSAAAPQWSNVWAVLIVLGVLGSIFADRSAGYGKETGWGWRYAVSFGVIFVFIFSLFAIMRPTENNQAGAFYPLVIAVYYCFTGIWTKGWRLLPLGLALMALTVGGYFLLPDYFMYWMAAVGGGGLIVGGIWLRNS